MTDLSATSRAWIAFAAAAGASSALAQESAPLDMVGTSEGASGAPAGAEGASAPPPAGPGSMLIWLLPVGLLFVLMFTSGRAAKKEAKKKAALLESLTKLDRVQTAGGLIGSIVEIHGDELVLKVDESTGTRIRVARSAIQTVLKESPQRSSAETAEAA